MSPFCLSGRGRVGKSKGDRNDVEVVVVLIVLRGHIDYVDYIKCETLFAECVRVELGLASYHVLNVLTYSCLRGLIDVPYVVSFFNTE